MQTSQHYSNIFNTIVTNIIQTPRPNPNQNHQNSFKHAPDNYSPQLLKKMEDFHAWGDIIRRVSPETFSARMILSKTANSTPPLFSSNRAYRIKQFIAEIDTTTPKIRSELIGHFCKFKQTYWAFSKLARIWKIRRTPVRIQTDLYMNELDANHPTTFQLVNTSGIYLFSLQNLARIIVDAITHQSGMFLEPLPIKNPYTNDVLAKSDLFNIYFAMHHNHIRIHEFFEKFFKCEFNIYEFRRKHETELRDYAIEQYAKTASTSELSQDISDMLMLHKMTNRIRVAPGFPKPELVKTMRPFLKLYLLERYSFSSMMRKYASKQVNLELRKFADKNPDYGMRIPMQFVPPPNFNPFSPNHHYIATQPAFVTSTEPHNSYCESRYSTTHVYDDNTFEYYVEQGDSLNTYEVREDSPMPALVPVQEPEPSPVIQTNPYQTERIQEHALAILSRLGRASSASTINNHNSIIINQLVNNYISNVGGEQEPDNYDDEVINNSPYEHEQDDSDMEIDNEYEDDGEDSVS
jgi:hypothetical protein